MDSIENLTLDTWNTLNTSEKKSLAKEIEKCCEAKFEDLAEFQCGDTRQTVAIFSKDGSTFSLIPGGTVNLGYQHGQAVDLPEDEKGNWLESLIEHGAITENETIEDYLKTILTEKRQARLRPYLIEHRSHPAEVYYESAEDDDESTCHEMICACLSEQGYRLPTADEWEFASSGGSRHLFPWGNKPTDGLVDAKPNAFGLYVNLDSYQCECTDEPMIMRGGDGGTRECGCMYDTFITQAPAYFEDLTTTDAVAEYYETALVRRVIQV